MNLLEGGNGNLRLMAQWFFQEKIGTFSKSKFSGGILGQRKLTQKPFFFPSEALKTRRLSGDSNQVLMQMGQGSQQGSGPYFSLGRTLTLVFRTSDSLEGSSSQGSEQHPQLPILQLLIISWKSYMIFFYLVSGGRSVDFLDIDMNISKAVDKRFTLMTDNQLILLSSPNQSKFTPLNITYNSAPCKITDPFTLCSWAYKQKQVTLRFECVKYPCLVKVLFAQVQLMKYKEGEFNQFIQMGQDQKGLLQVSGRGKRLEQIQKSIHQLKVFTNASSLEIKQDKDKKIFSVEPQALYFLYQAQRNATLTHFQKNNDLQVVTPLNKINFLLFYTKNNLTADKLTEGKLHRLKLVCMSSLSQERSIDLLLQNRHYKIVVSKEDPSTSIIFRAKSQTVDIMISNQFQIELSIQIKPEPFTVDVYQTILASQSLQADVLYPNSRPLVCKADLPKFSSCQLTPHDCVSNCKLNLKLEEASDVQLMIEQLIGERKQERRYPVKQLNKFQTVTLHQEMSYYFNFTNKQHRQFIIKVNRQDVFLFFTSNQSCRPPLEDCAQLQGSLNHPVQIIEELAQQDFWFVEVVSLVESVADISVQAFDQEKDQVELVMNRQYTGSLSGHEYDQFRVSLGQEKEVQVRLTASQSSKLRLLVKVDKKTKLYSLEGVLEVKPKKANSKIQIMVQKIENSKEVIDYSLIVANKNYVQYLHPGKEVFFKLNSKAAAKLILIKPQDVHSLMFVTSLDRLPKTPLTFSFQQLSNKSADYSLKKTFNTIKIGKQFTNNLCAGKSLCHIVIQLTNPDKASISVNLMVTHQASVIQLRDGFWTHVPVQAETHFRFNVRDISKDIDIYQNSISGKILCNYKLVSTNQIMRPEELPFPEVPEVSNYLKHDFSTKINSSLIRQTCQKQENDCFLLLTLKRFSDGDIPSSISLNTVAVMVTTQILQISSQQMILELGAEEEILNFRMSSYFQQKQKEGLFITFQTISGEAIASCSFTSPKHFKLPSLQDNQFIIRQNTILFHEDILKYLKLAEIQLQESDIRLYFSIFSYNRSQVLISTVFNSRPFRMITLGKPHSFQLQPQFQQIFSFYPYGRKGIIVKIQKQNGNLQIANKVCEGSQDFQCFNQTIPQTNYQNVRLSYEKQLDQQDCFGCMIMISVKTQNESGSGVIYVYSQDTPILLQENTPFQDTIQHAESAYYQIATRPDIATTIFVTIKQGVPKFESTTKSPLKELNSEQAQNNLTTKVLELKSKQTFQIIKCTCTGYCSFSLHFQSLFGDVYMYQGNLISKCLTLSLEDTCFIFQSQKKAYLDLFFDSPTQANAVTISKGTTKQDILIQAKSPNNSLTFRLQLDQTKNVIMVKKSSQLQRVCFQALVTTEGTDVLLSGITLPVGLKPSQQRQFSLEVKDDLMWLLLQIRVCTMSTLKFSQTQKDQFQEYILISVDTPHRSLIKVRNGQFFLKLKNDDKQSRISLTATLLQSKSMADIHEVKAGNNGQVLYQVQQSNKVSINFSPLENVLKGDKIQYYLIVGTQFEAVLMQSSCPQLLFADKTQENKRPKLFQPTGNQTLSTSVYMINHKYVTVVGKDSKGHWANYRVIEVNSLFSSSRIVKKWLGFLAVGLIVMTCLCLRRKKNQYSSIDLDDL